MTTQIWGILFYFLSLPFFLYLLSGLSHLWRLNVSSEFRSIDGKRARIVGIARASEELRTPIGNDSCCWFETKVGQANDSTTTFESSALIPFFIDCPNGPLLIDPLMIAMNDPSLRSIWRKSSARDLEMAKARGIQFERNSQFTVEERWIENGAEVVVLGMMKPDENRDGLAAQKRMGQPLAEAIAKPFLAMQEAGFGRAPLPRLRGFVKPSSAVSLSQSVGGAGTLLYVGSLATVKNRLYKQILILLTGAAVLAALGFRLF